MTEVQLAEARVAAARLRLQTTTSALQARLDPRSMARDAVDGITETSERALRSGVEVVRANPGAVGGAVAAIGALLAGAKFVASRRTKKH